MTDAMIAIAVVVLLIAGFWWTRGYGGVPGGIDDPAQNELSKYVRGKRVPEPGIDEPPEDPKDLVE